MKVLSFILAVYFLSLSMLACSDESGKPDNCKTATCTHIDASQDADHEGDECSPLCMCHCCGGVTLVYEHSDIFKENYTLIHKSIYSENSTSEVSFSVWQPPKLV